MKFSTALKKARATIFSDGVNILQYRSDGQCWATTMSTDCHGSRAFQIRKAVARARRNYAEQLMIESERA